MEGLLEFEEIRDFIYSRMCGHRDAGEGAARDAGAKPPAAGAADDLASALREVAGELRAIRTTLESGSGTNPGD